MGPVAQAAREARDRATMSLRVAIARAALADGGQKSPDREAETPDGAEAGGQPSDVVEAGAEISADAVVRNEAGEEVER